MTHLTDLLRSELAIVQAPMAGSQDVALAQAVSGAGALGSIPAAMLGPDALRDQIASLRSAGTTRFNVNFFTHQRPVADPVVLERWRQRLAPLYDELGVPTDDVALGGGRQPFDDAMADVLEDTRPPVVSFHFGLPEPRLLARVRSWKPVVMSSATTEAEGVWLQSQGVDVVIAQGFEAGGHRGMFLTTDLATQLGTVALVRRLVRRLDVPVIAAGGIADAAGVRSMLALGAAGVQVGTAYLSCPEATTSLVHRTALADPASQTALTNVFTGRPARGIVNRFMQAVGPLADDAPAFPLASALAAPLRAAAERAGSGDFSPLWSGQHVVHGRSLPAADLTAELADGSIGG